MSNYLYNAKNGVAVCATSADLRVERNIYFIDTETGQEIGMCAPQVGKTYECRERWSIYKGFVPVAHCNTEREAVTKLSTILRELKDSSDNIIEVK